MNAVTETKWFLQLGGRVQGPLTQETLQTTLESFDTETSNQALVWKRGLSEWIRASRWQNVPAEVTITPAHDRDTQTSTANAGENTLFEKTFTQTYTEGLLYRVQINFVDQPPMTKTELMTLVAKQEDVSKVSIMEPKSKEWKEVYAFPDIVERLGLSRRKQPRVPILAQFTGKTNKKNDVSYRVITISQGGIGFTENYDLKIGDEVEGQIASPHFFQPIHVKADVIYAGQDGYIGLKFSSLTDEARSAIIEYIKKFGKSSANIP